ncbi:MULTISPECIES: TetR/AcrR family transcriptional regulator [unclassified Arthrobacter]|uniref:TetR/AcrR family transcriptional regulator n=1 Tax=unclassified Arthrobacter TaxID=235627 RepID=UPI00159E0BD4|nr:MULTISPECIES: TetR/AcrR family transcriptional regulator [unclassified Arthrobacter]MCQ9163385.1 TetR family transcriptional regulator [Arthrobacter sp. STN4]NVM97583.1 TetR/AcrR family transcriptional regulator [Arthrobacter sp. SDTb3-6]
MARPSTREAVIHAARQLFGERGYTAVTVKDVAALAGYSPAMVMKVMGSKAKLYAAAAPEVPSSDVVTEFDEPLGFALVRRILRRRRQGEPEPWSMVPLLVQDAPDQEAARAELRERYTSWMAAQIGDTSPARQKSQLVVCVVMGLGAGIRVLGLLDGSDIAEEELIQHYGAIIQGIVDEPAGE